MTRVMEDPDEIAAALRGTVLDGLPIEEGLGETWVVTGIEQSQLLSAWRAARAAVSETGRWPVLTGVNEEWHDATAEEIEALDQESRTVDPWTVFRWWGTNSPLDREEVHLWLPHQLGEDFAQQVGRDVTLPTTLLAVERLTWERLLTDPAAVERGWRAAANFVGTRYWFTPPEGVQLVLLPTPRQWLAPAWLNYFGALRPQGPEGLAAALRQWEQQWGAELVASWGTMLQFVVNRQPALGEQAWQLALQILALASNLESNPWELALALTRSDAWFLHDRP
ncbi:DUF4253 domain-containing protein [Micromonospora zamorensis]|uniref:DUF4253 domain-containing protein n=1 Tax=Micromonospora zamorensis TaxID=709883 RepID=UPI000B5AFAAC|nr:DUF4253 domain-containing protein [Micromonospora zamorensis]WTE86392.1 DUF4253 domain-containing protein [Micromonospora zamorensis]